MKTEKQREMGTALLRAIGKAASRLPPTPLLMAAIGSVAASAALRWAGKKGFTLVVGELIPTVVLLSLYTRTTSRMGRPAFQHELRPGSAKWDGPSEEPAANVSAAATPGVPL